MRRELTMQAMTVKYPTILAVVLFLGVLTEIASAESLDVKAVMVPKEQIYVDLPTSEKHFVLFVKREGKAAGTGILNGAELTEYGMHDIRPGLDGSPRGYVVAKLPNGDQTVIQWEVQAVFVPGPDGKPKLLDNGVWHVIGGTGTLEKSKGAGTMHIKAVSPNDREFTFSGEIVIQK
jgi:hypothetical protein